MSENSEIFENNYESDTKMASSDFYYYKLRIKSQHENLVNRFLKIRKSFELCKEINCSFELLQELILNPTYSEFQIPKKNKTFRNVQAPRRELKIIQQRINKILQYYYYYKLKPEPVNGFVIRPKGENKTCNIVSNASIHVGRKYVLNMDLKDFFSSINSRQIYELFLSHHFNFNDQIAKSLTFLTTYNGYLPTGAPTSPVLSNFICLEFDAKLEEYCNSNQLYFSRYADDITFSTDTQFTDIQINELNELIKSFRFEVNTKKVHIKRNSSKQLVTGLVVNHKVNVERKLIKKVRAMLHNLSTNGLEAAALKHFKGNKVHKDIASTFINQLEGYINFIGQVRGKKDTIYTKYKLDFTQLKDKLK